MKKIISLLGSTGSIGQQALNVARSHNIKLKALSTNTNVKLIEEQAREFEPQIVCVANENLYSDLRIRLADTGIKVVAGVSGLLEIASLKVDILLNSIVGMAGLIPTLEAIKFHNHIALANKETLVAGGFLVMEAARKNNVSIIPVDSEHSAIFQCLLGNNQKEMRKIILTASGGPFYGYTTEMLKVVGKKEALSHPNWNMGNKITVDSATLMNKGLEFIEAIWLFDLFPEQIEVVIHRQSIVHSAVEYIDGSVIAQLGVPDMRVPIQFALSYPCRYKSDVSPLSLLEIRKLTFEPPPKEFGCLKIAKLAALKGGNAGCIINSANERAVQAFLQEEIRFLDISELVERAYYNIPYISKPSLEQILETEKYVHQYVEEEMEKL